jgi:hypothetical protein
MKLLIVVLVIIIAYAYCYFIFPKNISILQSNLKDFDFNLLYQRQPLVIEDCVEDIKYLISLWFSGNIIEDYTTKQHSDRLWHLNSHKYMYCYCLQDDIEILLYPAGKQVIDDVPDNNEPVIAIALKKSQSIIIPYRWYFHIKNENDIQFYGIHDYMTYIIDKFI